MLSTKSQFSIVLILVCGLILLVSACKKDKGNPPEPCPCSGEACIDEMMAYTYFLPGTWWVYEEQTSGDRDSVYVYEASSSIGSDGSHHFLMRAHSTYDEYNYYYQFTESLQTFSLIKGECRVHRVKRTKTRPGDFVGTGVWFFYPLLLNDFRYVGGGLLSVDSLFLNEAGFVEQVFFDIDDCYSEEYEHAGFHLERNLGVVRKTRFDLDQIWNLQEFNIVQ